MACGGRARNQAPRVPPVTQLYMGRAGPQVTTGCGQWPHKVTAASTPALATSPQKCTKNILASHRLCRDMQLPTQCPPANTLSPVTVSACLNLQPVGQDQQPSSQVFPKQCCTSSGDPGHQQGRICPRTPIPPDQRSPKPDPFGQGLTLKR